MWCPQTLSPCNPVIFAPTDKVAPQGEAVKTSHFSQPVNFTLPAVRYSVASGQCGGYDRTLQCWGESVAKCKKAPTQSSSGRTRKPAAERKGAGRKATARSATASLVTLDRRAGSDRRGLPDRRKTGLPVVVERRKLQRRVKVNRRRQIDPTTCERDYTAEEIEFMSALDAYKRSSGRMFPTCSEVLEVIRALGYEKQPGDPAPAAPSREPTIGPEEAIQSAEPGLVP